MRIVNAKTKDLVRAALVVGVLAVVWVLATDEGGPLGFVSLLLAVLTGVLLVLAMLSAIRGMDELQRQIQLEALALAFGGISLLAFVQIGFDDWGHPFVIGQGNFLLILDGLWLLGYFLAQRRYQ